MMRAAASGQDARARASSELTRQRTIGVEQGQNLGRMTGQAAIQGENLKESRRQFDESAAARSRELEAARELEREQMVARQQEAQANRAFQEEQAEADRELTAARSGLQRAPDNPRAQALQAEMDRGAQQTGARNLDDPQVRQGMAAQVRGQGPGALDPQQQQNLRDQTGRGMELDRGGRSWVPTPEARQSQQFDLEQKAYRAQTERLKAEAYREQVAASRMRARMQGDEEKVERLTKELEQPIISNTSRLNRFQKGEPTANDWASLRSAAAAYAAADPKLSQDIEAKAWTPRVRQFLSMQINKDALKFVQYTGTLPDTKKTGFDASSPIMQQFTQAAGQVGAWMSSQPQGLQAWAGITSFEDKTEFVNRFAAMMTLSGMMLEAGAQAPEGFSGLTPSAGQTQQQGPQPMADQQLGEQRLAEQESAVGRGAQNSTLGNYSEARLRGATGL